MRPDIAPGGRFPDYALPDHTGTRRMLSEIQDGDPMILVLSRGAFCPKDRQQHRLLVELEPEIRVAYTKMVTVSTDKLLELNEMRTGVGAHWPFLSDPDGYWYWGRPGPEDLRHDLREVTKKIRTDWDLDKPELREAWARGDKKSFWPYGKSLKEVFAKSA